MDEETSKLFPEINPNVEELIERESAIDSENVIVETTMQEKTEEKDMFMKKKNKKVVFKDEVGEKNVKIKVADKLSETKNVKKDKYAHLAAARQKGIETRRRKAAEKRAAKEAEKAKKAEEKAARKKATMERNRQKARERYYKEKEKKQNQQKNIPQKIYEETKPRGMIQKIHAQQKPSGMDFNTFAKYMMKYENMKEAYNKQKQKKIQKKVEKVVEKKQPSYHSNNYPLAHLYNPNFRNKEYTF